ncbi:MAG: universal stress protein [Deltaproteobacteria bacterium]|nr:universal stress protein [Deltaproteobacteria bacterium]MBW2154721.1 universal stress protein [Deltaproteobacteria bacterium]
MDEIQNIMVAVDFSDYSINAVRYAMKMAGDVKASILLVNVVNQKEIDAAKKIASEYQAFDMQKYIQDTVSFRKKEFERIIAECGSSVPNIKTSIRIGVPYEELLKEIDEKQPDLLIMGTKGRTNLVDTIIGSCTQKMFRRCTIPLLILRNH